MTEGQKNLVGCILLAETELEDPNFAKTMVLLVEHNENGAMGLVLNSDSGLTLKDACNVPITEGFAAEPLHVGGPVEREYLLVVHTGFPGGERSPESVVLPDDLVFEPNFSLVSSCWEHYANGAAMDGFRIRFFSGYAGWGAGQLETELALNSWVVVESRLEFCFPAPGQEAWLAALARKGGVHWVYARTGYKPSLN